MLMAYITSWSNLIKIRSPITRPVLLCHWYKHQRKRQQQLRIYRWFYLDCSWPVQFKCLSHDRTHQASVIPPFFFTEVSMSNHERSCTCVLHVRVYIVSLYTILRFDFGIGPTVRYILFLYFIAIEKNTISLWSFCEKMACMVDNS